MRICVRYGNADALDESVRGDLSCKGMLDIFWDKESLVRAGRPAI